MQTKTLIQAQANILRITELKKGNVVKVIDTSYSDKKINFGVVTDLLNEGEKSFIQILLFEQSYNNVTGKIKVYEGNDDIPLFPATVEEVQEHMTEALTGLQKGIIKDEEDLRKKKQVYKTAKDFVSGQTAKKLTEAGFEEITTSQYLEEKKIAKIKEIQGE